MGRIPADVLGLLDDLFRAKFTGVRKYEATATSAPAQAGVVSPRS